MPRIELTTVVPATIETIYDACLDVEVHTLSTGRSGERAVAGVTTGILGPDDTVTWLARHFGIRWRMTVQITEYRRPHSFVDEQVSGPFRRWRHEHTFTTAPEEPSATVMRDIVEFTAPGGVVGSLVAAILLRPYLQRLIQRRNTYLADLVTRRR